MAWLSVLTATAPAWANTDTVTTTADGVPGSLRAEIESAIPGDTVTFAPGLTGTITLLTGPIAINTDLTISGPGPSAITVDGNANGSVFEITGSATDAVSGLGFTHASTAAIDMTSSGGLTVDNSTFAANAAGGVGAGAGGSGGAIDADGASSVTLDGDTFAGDTASGVGGGQGGAVAMTGGSSLTITNSTFASNTASAGGGAIFTSAPTVLTSDTIDANSAPSGSAIAGAANVTATGTIVSANQGAPNCDGPVMASGYDLEGPAGQASCGFTAGTDLTPADPRLAPLGSGDGPTPTQAIAPGSPAFAAIPAANCPESTDQRGDPRPGLHETACDVGAYEFQFPRITITALSCPAASPTTSQPETCEALVTDIDSGGTKTTPQGTVTFAVVPSSSGAFAPARCALTPAAGFANQATCTVTYTPEIAGAQRLTAAYVPSDEHAASAGSATLDANLAPTTTTLLSSANPAVTGQRLTYVAVVSPVPDSGTVGFSDGEKAIADCTAVRVVSGEARCSLTYPLSGTHVVQASYSGDSYFASSSSPSRTETVLPAASVRGVPSVRNGLVRFVLTCAATSGGCRSLRAQLTTVETLVGSRLTAIAARARRVQRTVFVASRRLALRAGRTIRVTLRLSAAGRALLGRYHRLPVLLRVVMFGEGGRAVVFERKLMVRPARGPR